MTRAGPTIREATPADQNKWDELATHPLQSWAWGRFRMAMGIDVMRFAIVRHNSAKSRLRPELVEGWQITFHKIPFTPWTVGYFPKGPTPSKEMIDTLTRVGQKKRAIFIQLEPHAFANNVTMKQFNNLKASHHPLFTKYTFVLNLTKTEEELLKAMHPKTRYNIRLAQKHGVEVKEDSSATAFNQYLRLTAETTGRQGFYAHNTRYHQTMWQIIKNAKIAHLFTASYKGHVLTTWIVFIWKDTLYYPYGASSRIHREVMAPTLMLWEIARWAKKKGLKYFDLWGALGPNPDEKDPWFGFHRFKQGFSPELREFIGSYDLIIHPILYRLYAVADMLRWALLKYKA